MIERLSKISTGKFTIIWLLQKNILSALTEEEKKDISKIGFDYDTFWRNYEEESLYLDMH